MTTIPAKCNACNNTEIRNFYEVKDLPLILFPVDAGVRHQIKQANLSSFICGNCFHIFTNLLSDENASLIYGDYYRFYPYENLESMNHQYRKPFEVFFERTVEKHLNNHSKNNRLLEIGCSSGKQLEYFEKFNFSCYGIDPSPLNDTGESRLISGYYQDYQFKQQYNIIVARFVLEHVTNLDTFLNKIHNDLEDEGVAFLQVPNIREFIINFIPSFLAHEHTQYFNDFSMATAFIKNNFEVIDIVAENNQSIIIAVTKSKNGTGKNIKKPSSAEFSNFITERNLMRNTMIEFLKSKKDNICFYGSGLVIAWILYDLDYKSLCESGTIIDDNKIIEGRYMPRTDYMVSGQDKLYTGKYQNILLTLNPVYNPQVLKKLHDKGFQGNIYAISGNEIIKC